MDTLGGKVLTYLRIVVVVHSLNPRRVSDNRNVRVKHIFFAFRTIRLL